MENPVVEQQISDLEQKLVDRKAESSSSEKEIIHQIVGEKIQEHVPNYTSKAPTSSQAGDIPSYFTEDLKNKVQELINIVFNKSIDDGIKAASDSGNTALIDAFHDVLVDELYNSLLERKKVQPVN